MQINEKTSSFFYHLIYLEYKGIKKIRKIVTHQQIIVYFQQNTPVKTLLLEHLAGLPYGTHLIIHASPTEGAARAVSSSLEHCQVVTEEDRVNRKYPLTQNRTKILES